MNVSGFASSQSDLCIKAAHGPLGRGIVVVGRAKDGVRMIANEHQHELTRRKLADLDALRASVEAGTAGDDGFRDLQAAALASVGDDLREELTKCEVSRA